MRTESVNSEYDPSQSAYDVDDDIDDLDDDDNVEDNEVDEYDNYDGLRLPVFEVYIFVCVLITKITKTNRWSVFFHLCT